MAAAREVLDEQVSIRLTRRDLARLEALSNRIAIASRNAIARKALQMGVTILEKNPGLLVEGTAPRRKESRWRR
jgi:hypothetical protein